MSYDGKHRYGPPDEFPRLDWDPLFSRLVWTVIAVSFLAIFAALVWPT